MNQFFDFFSRLLDTSDWPPRWHCGKWTEFHGWLYIISDLLVWSAYFAIPFIIIRFISRRHDAQFIRLYFLFAAFILACGATHFFDAVTFWFPVYRINALVRAITGIISWVTVFYLIKVLPIANSLRTAHELEEEVEQRKKAESKFRNFLERVPDSIIVVNDDGLIQLVNAKTVTMFGYDREEMIGHHIERLLPERYGSLHPFRRFKTYPGPQSTEVAEGFELFAMRKDGQEFPVELTLSPMETEEGPMLTASIRDVSEKKQLEKVIRDTNITLERKVKQRTEELERKNKELEQFAYVASHDMQEPLRTTASFVDLLRKQYKGKLDENADKYLDYIVQSSDRMKILIRDLLDYSRLGREKEKRQVDCNSIIEQVKADLNRVIRESQAEIRSGKLPLLDGFPTELKLLFQNLVSNSIKFRRPGIPPTVAINASRCNGAWQFSVTDNGIGIESQYQEKIFVIFQRLHNRTDYEGSGIGLAHCKKIVELHGGQIWVESIPGEGSTFHFTISEIQ
ncbi:PAS domain-containing sensor histidine kinase [Paraflavitalea sp. CAU 1676]|uniref:sensor histidine kinase n=1 Tax=Paraflavitalea sp. CAU 1676 TaxID=3032598 RepID=UPI0023DC8ADE|nr:PAS domain-containing sensor histidine kinase [Paraflavitalea sp. CAU 1676]MDF2188791.1 PAS domain S-box protein [Paraflavitalea sp. CAU 1676]